MTHPAVAVSLSEQFNGPSTAATPITEGAFVEWLEEISAGW